MTHSHGCLQQALKNGDLYLQAGSEDSRTDRGMGSSFLTQVDALRRSEEESYSQKKRLTGRKA